MTRHTDQILEKLVRDVESSVHALYRGEVRQSTAKAHTDRLLAEARAALATATTHAVEAVATGGIPRLTPARPSGPHLRHSGGAPVQAGLAYGWTSEDSDAVLKCIMSWLPVGTTASTAPDTKCIAAGRMLVPTWGEREKAREAVKLIAGD